MNKYQHLINKYKEIFRKIHENEFRNDNKTPYFYHLEQVAAITEQLFFENIYEDWTKAGLIILSFGHDGLENHPEKYNSLFLTELQKDKNEDYFGEYFWFPYLKSGIEAISKKEKGKEDYTDYLLRVKNHEWARMVKIADLTHNMSDLKPGNLKDKYSISKYFLEH